MNQPVLPADQDREERIQGPACALSVRVYGAGVPVLALHGYSDSGFSYSRLARQMRGFCLIAPDFRGHGKSDGSGLPLTLEQLTQDAEAVLGALVAEPVYVIGHSMGAMVAIRLASRRRVRAMALLGGALAIPNDSADKLREHMAKLLEHGFAAPNAFDDWHHCERALPKWFSDQLAVEARRLSAATWNAGLKTVLAADVSLEAGLVMDPTITMYGTKDPYFHEAVQKRLSKALRAVRSIELKDAGHNPHWELPETVGTAIRNFFRLN